MDEDAVVIETFCGDVCNRIFHIFHVSSTLKAAITNSFNKFLLGI